MDINKEPPARDFLERHVEAERFLDFVSTRSPVFKERPLPKSKKEAIDLMIKDTYQEKEEATAKLQRAQLSSCQLPTYFVGWKGWLNVREYYRQKKGAAYSLKGFHEAALKESAVALPALEGLLN